MMRRWSVLFSVCLVCSGCSGAKTIQADAAASAQRAYDDAVVAFKVGDDELALTLLDAALGPGSGLPPDIYTDALVKRAVCRARAEQYDDALADLEIASQGAADMSLVHAARSFVYKKQGKSTAASAEMSAAKKINRRVKAFR